MIEHELAVEDEAPVDRFAGEYVRQPERVVRPHLVERQRVAREPERDRLVRFVGVPLNASALNTCAKSL